jgi:hypothetical protein
MGSIESPFARMRACNLEGTPLRIAFQPTGAQPISFDLVGFSAVLVEDGDVADADGPNKNKQKVLE